MIVAAVEQHATIAIDPVKLEIIRTGIQAIPDLIETDLMRTAFSPLIYEYKDYAVGLISSDGRALALATHGLALFTSVMGRAILDGLEVFGLDRIEPGDAIITNYAGTLGQHLNNVVMYTPIFGAGERPVAFMAVTVHWLDVGGRYPGSCLGTDTTDLFQEGLHLRSIKLYKRGELDEDVLRVIEYNTRLPDMLLGDIAAQYAGCLKGRQLFDDLMARHGESVLFGAIEAIWQNSERAARAAVRAVPNGQYEARSFLDSDGVDLERRIPIIVKVEIKDGDFIVDLSDCSDQLRGPFNSGRYGGAETCARIAFKYLFSPDDAPNEGGFAPVKVIIPDGKFLSATGNAPLGGYSTPLCTVVDTIIAAMAPILPERTAAGHHSSFGVYGFSGMNPKTGRFFSWFDTAHGGWGGSALSDGVGPYKTITHADTKDIPVETIEALYPMLVERYEWRLDTAGAGRHRGGLGLDKTIRVLAACNLNASFERYNCPPWGLNGGLSGAPGYIEVETSAGRRAVQKVSQLAVEPGDRLYVHTGAGGGFGPAVDRDPEAVRRDVAYGYISKRQAEELYGVIFDQRGHIDFLRTQQSRANLRISSQLSSPSICR
jgi:N-methylhydantoinase B